MRIYLLTYLLTKCKDLSPHLNTMPSYVANITLQIDCHDDASHKVRLINFDFRGKSVFYSADLRKGSLGDKDCQWLIEKL